MPSPVVNIARHAVSQADPRAQAGPPLGGCLPAVERALATLDAPSWGWLSGVLGLVTGSMDRDGLQSRYEAWQGAQALADDPAQVRALVELRAAFERFQDTCSADDYLVVQKVYADIDAALARLREPLASRPR